MMEVDLIDKLQIMATYFESFGPNKSIAHAATIRQAVAEIRRLRELVDGQQPHSETYGRRSGGGKEILFK